MADKGKRDRTEVTELTIGDELGRGYAHMTDAEVSRDLDRRIPGLAKARRDVHEGRA